MMTIMQSFSKLGFGILAFGLLQAGAAEAGATWTGPVRVTSASDACEVEKIAAGKILMTSYSPLSTNGDSDISFAAKPRVFHLHVTEALFEAGRTYSNTFLVDANGTAVTMVAESHSTKVIAWDQTPDEPLIADQVIAISGKFTNFMSRKGCTVAFKGKLIQQPD
jgi:hypothetical protein